MTTVERPVLGFEDAIAVKSAQGWLALGILEEAERELRKLKNGATLHPEARKVFRQLQIGLEDRRMVIRRRKRAVVVLGQLGSSSRERDSSQLRSICR